MDSNGNNANPTKRQAMADWGEIIESSDVDRVASGGATVVIKKIIAHLPKTSPLLDPLRNVVRPHHADVARYFDEAMDYLYENEYRKSANALRIAQRLSFDVDFDLLRGYLHLEQVNWFIKRDRYQEAITEFKFVEALVPNHHMTTQETLQRLGDFARKFKEEQERKRRKQQTEINEHNGQLNGLQKKATERLIIQQGQKKEKQKQAEEQKKEEEKRKQKQREEYERKRIVAELRLKQIERTKTLLREAQKQNDWQQVVTLLEQLCQLDPNNIIYQTNLAGVKRSKARIHFKKAHDFLSRQLLKEALDEVEQASALLPKASDILNLRQRVQELINFEKRLPQIVETAGAHLSGGNIVKASEVYRSILMNFPSHLVARDGLARIHFKKAHDLLSRQLLKEALDEVEQASVLVPQAPNILNLRRRIQELIDFEKRLPQVAETAGAHLSGGNIVKAREVYHSILMNFPGNLLARDGLVNCRCLEIKRKLRIPARLLYLQWWLINGVAIGVMVSQGIIGWELLIPLIFLCGPWFKGRSLAKLKNSSSFRVPIAEIIYCSLIYFPFGWLGILWAKICLAFDPAIIDVFDDQIKNFVALSHVSSPDISTSGGKSAQ